MIANLKPLITETSLTAAKDGRFTFKGPKTATKGELKEFIQNTFKVSVVAISTMVVKGEHKRSNRKKAIVRLPDWKKIIVQLKKGQKIDLFDISQS